MTENKKRYSWRKIINPWRKIREKLYILKNEQKSVNELNMTVKSYTDMLGRNFKTEYADGSYSMNYYNTKNQLIKSVTAGGVVTLYAKYWHSLKDSEKKLRS